MSYFSGFFCASPQISISTLMECQNVLQAGPTSPGPLTVIPVLLCTSPHIRLPSWKATFNSNDWQMSPIYPDMFLKKRLGNREKSSFVPLFTSCLSLNPLLYFLANFSNVDTTKRSICIVQSTFNHFNMETIPGHQATNCPFLIFSLLFLLGFGYVVWLDQVQLVTSWEVQGFPEFIIYPEKAPVGKLHRSFSGSAFEDTTVVLFLLGCS